MNVQMLLGGCCSEATSWTAGELDERTGEFLITTGLPVWLQLMILLVKFCDSSVKDDRTRANADEQALM